MFGELPEDDDILNSVKDIEVMLSILLKNGVKIPARIWDLLEEIRKYISQNENTNLKKVIRPQIPILELSPLTWLNDVNLVRTLESIGIFSRNDLLKKSPKQLLEMGVGAEDVLRIVLILSEKNFYLRPFEMEKTESLTLDSSIILLQLDYRILRKLYFFGHNIFTVGQLIGYSKSELLSFRRIGKKSVETIEQALKKYNFSLMD